MSGEFRLIHETRAAMFWAALAEQCAGEKHVTSNRIVASLLRSPSAEEFFSLAEIDREAILGAVDDAETLSFDDCERAIRTELIHRGLEFASKEHQATVQLRPLEPAVKQVFDRLLERHDQFAIPPLELLLQLIRADLSIAERLASHGLTDEAISAGLEKR